MSHEAKPELTFRAVTLAIILAVILAAANTYLGLFAGMTIASAIPAAVVSMAILRMLGGGHILENNIVSTGASAGSSIATGVIFTMPALIIPCDIIERRSIPMSMIFVPGAEAMAL